MNSRSDDLADEHGVVSGVRGAVSGQTVALVLMGVTAGYSVSVLGADAVSLPVVGSTPGLLVGAVGLTATAVAYRKIGCCSDCGSRKQLSGGCGCSGDCEDSCSVDS